MPAAAPSSGTSSPGSAPLYTGTFGPEHYDITKGVTLKPGIESYEQWTKNPIYAAMLKAGWEPNALAGVRPGQEIFGAYGLTDPIQAQIDALMKMNPSLNLPTNLVNIAQNVGFGPGGSWVDPLTGKPASGAGVSATAQSAALKNQAEINAAQQAETTRQSELAAKGIISNVGQPDFRTETATPYNQGLPVALREITGTPQGQLPPVGEAIPSWIQAAAGSPSSLARAFERLFR